MDAQHKFERKTDGNINRLDGVLFPQWDQFRAVYWAIQNPASKFHQKIKELPIGDRFSVEMPEQSPCWIVAISETNLRTPR